MGETGNERVKALGEHVFTSDLFILFVHAIAGLQLTPWMCLCLCVCAEYRENVDVGCWMLSANLIDDRNNVKRHRYNSRKTSRTSRPYMYMHMDGVISV